MQICDCKWRRGEGMTWHDGNCALVRLSPEAKARVDAKVESVRRARNYAMAHAHETVIG